MKRLLESGEGANRQAKGHDWIECRGGEGGRAEFASKPSICPSRRSRQERKRAKKESTTARRLGESNRGKRGRVKEGAAPELRT